MNEFQIKNSAGEVVGTLFCREVFWTPTPLVGPGGQASAAAGDGFFVAVFGDHTFSHAGICFLQAGWSVQKVTK